jgi:hypothetical protein
MESSEIHAVIGVWHRHGRTFYVKRSPKMVNYPSVWSLLSIQFEPYSIDPVDFIQVGSLMSRMADDRLGGIGLRVLRYLSSAACTDNPMRKRVVLHMYQVELEAEPELNENYYIEFAWMTPGEYAVKAKDATCGLCMRMWSDYCVRHGLAGQSFARALMPEDLLMGSIE